MVKVVQLLAILFISYGCSKNMHTVNIYDESTPDVSDDLIYCDTCITMIDAYKYEIARGSQPIHHKITLQQLRHLFNFEGRRASGRLRGEITHWENAIFFVEVRPDRGYKVLHGYAVGNWDKIVKYVAKIYFKDKIIDNYIIDNSSSNKDYRIIKAIYKKNKIRLDKIYGFAAEHSSNIDKKYENPLALEVRQTDEWQTETIHATNLNIYKMYINSNFLDCEDCKNSDIARINFYNNLQGKDLSVYYLNKFFMPKNVRDSIFDSWPLAEKKEKMTKKAFVNYIEWLQRYEKMRFQDTIGLDTENLIKDPLMAKDGTYNNAMEMRNTIYFKKLMNEPFILPPGYIKPHIIDEKEGQSTSVPGF